MSEPSILMLILFVVLLANFALSIYACCQSRKEYRRSRYYLRLLAAVYVALEDKQSRLAEAIRRVLDEEAGR